MIEEIARHNADVICLQEIDHFSFFRKALATLGYVGHFTPKPDSPCLYLADNSGPDGCAIFYKKDKFDLVTLDSRVLEVWNVQSNQVKMRKGEFRFLENHVQNYSILGGTLGNSQVQKDWSRSGFRYNSSQSQKRCFNANPQERTRKRSYGVPKCSSSRTTSCGHWWFQCWTKWTSLPNHDQQQIDQVSLSNPIPIRPKLLFLQFSRLASAYNEILNNEPDYTTWKFREDGEHIQTLDYIFYSPDQIRVDAVLEMPTGEQIGENRLPSLSYASDHFSLVTDLRLMGKRL